MFCEGGYLSEGRVDAGHTSAISAHNPIFSNRKAQNQMMNQLQKKLVAQRSEMQMTNL